MKIFLLILLSVVIIYVIYWFFQESRLSNVKFDELKKYIQILIKYGKHQSFIIIEIPHSKKFIQFAKYKINRSAGISFDFPKVNWSVNYYNELLNYLSTNKIKYNIRSEEIEFIHIDFKSNLNKTMELAFHILYNIFQIPKNQTLNLKNRIKIDDHVDEEMPFFDDSEKLGFKIGNFIGKVINLFKRLFNR